MTANGVYFISSITKMDRKCVKWQTKGTKSHSHTSHLTWLLPYLFLKVYWIQVDFFPQSWWPRPWHHKLNRRAAVWAHRSCFSPGKCVCHSVRWQWWYNLCCGCWGWWRGLCMRSCWSASYSGSLERTELQQDGQEMEISYQKHIC